MKVYVKGLKEARTSEEKASCFEDAMRTFKRRVNRDGIIQEVRKREFYEKPGVKRRHKHEEYLKSCRKKVSK